MNSEQGILFSIIIPTYNRASFIGKAIDSVINQTYTNWELIIIIDGAEDNTEEVVKKYLRGEKRLNYYLQDNLGSSVARNLGIDKSNGDFICFLDDDDYYLKNFLKDFFYEIKKNDFLEGFYLGKLLTLKNGILEKYNYPKKISIINHEIFIQPSCISRNILLDEQFDERFRIGYDYHLFLRILFKHKIYISNCFNYVYQIHDDSIMEKELTKNYYLSSRFDRLLMLDDIIVNFRKQIADIGIEEKFYTKYNRIAYFYASQALKTRKFKQSYNFLYKLKFKGNKKLYLYYIISTAIRMPFYFFKSLLCNCIK